MRSAVIVSFSFLATACTAGGPAVPLPWLAGPERVDVVDAPVDSDTLIFVPIDNIGTGLAEVVLEVGEPFEAVNERFSIPSGGRRTATLSWTPTDFEERSGLLTLSTGFDTFDIPIHGTVDTDQDDDGHLAAGVGGDDCDDQDAARYPGAVETCDGLDNDCNQIDDDVADPPVWFPDDDADGYGDSTAAGEATCQRPAAGWVTNALDCDDGHASVSPDALEVYYDGVDQDCSGTSDFDRDGDGYDSDLFGGDDCLDSDEDVHPGAVEVPGNNIDENCDGLRG